ncbi:MAG: BamA/TamA family outer membrane protein [Bacteroidetes bacterium]|nr:BamA/TamA family outer membrane protein [Bacteroidota bacterium]
MKHFRSAILFTVFYLLLSITIFAQSSKLYELSSINFEGNNEFSDADLKSIIQSKESPFWLWRLFNSFTPFGSPPTYFDSTEIKVDLVSLKSFYSVNGFFEVDFSYSYQLDSSSRSAELTYYISEGEGFYYGDINLFGLEELDYLQPFISPHLNSLGINRFTQVKLASKIDEVLSVLKDKGYMLATFDSTKIIIDTLRNKTDLDIYFTPGNHYRFSEIRVIKKGVGKDLVSDELIKYVTNLHVGDEYNEQEIAKSRLRLARTGLFNSINLKGFVDDTVGNKVPLNIESDIGNLNDLSPEVFIDNEFNTSNVGVGLSYVRKNFFGDARKLTLSTKFKVNDIQNIKLFSPSGRDSTLQTQVDISLLLEQPFFFNRAISASLEAYYKTYNISTTPFENEGGKLLLAVDMPSHTFINLLNPYLSFDLLGYDVISVDGESDFSPRNTTAIFGFNVGSTTANDIFFPFRGYNLNQVIELALTRLKITTDNPQVIDTLGFGEDDVGLYYRLQTMISEYIGVSRDDNTVIGVKFKIGYVQTFVGSDELIPPNQTFFSGGANSVRGWRARQLIPLERINSIDDLNPAVENIRGGTFLIEGSIEYRRKFDEVFGFNFFIDYGNTWNGYTDFQFNEIAVASGFGLRYYSPFAPFRIDFGWKVWDPQEKITLLDRAFWQAFEFHFGIGEAF